MHYFFPHLPELFLLCSGGLFLTTIGFAALWVRARERAPSPSSKGCA
jgi:hypothetical protein